MNRRPTVRARRALAAGVVVPLLAAGLASCGSDDATAGGKATAADSVDGVHRGDRRDPVGTAGRRGGRRDSSSPTTWPPPTTA